jgi:polysaccharide biosynthesis transport protein
MTWLNEQMTSLRGKVQESSVALQNYRVKAGIMGLQEQRQITAQKIMDFNKQYLESQAQRLSVEAKMNELHRTSDRGGAQTIFTVADSLLIQKLKQEASDLETTKAKLSKTYKDKHPEILKVDAQIEQVNQRIEAETKTMLRAVQTEFRVARAREETLLGNVNRLRTEAQELNEKEIQYLNLQRDADSNQQLYEAVLKRLKETGVTGGLETNNVSVIEEATIPRIPGPAAPELQPAPQRRGGAAGRDGDGADDRVLRHDGEDAR